MSVRYARTSTWDLTRGLAVQERDLPAKAATPVWEDVIGPVYAAGDPSARQNFRHEEDSQAEDDVDRQELNAFQPVRSSVVNDLPGN